MELESQVGIKLLILQSRRPESWVYGFAAPHPAQNTELHTLGFSGD